jgi:hypothetical protein
MRNSKLIEILKGLKTKDMEKLPKFLPFALADDTASVAEIDVIQLFNKLKPFFPHFDSSDVDADTFFKKYFPNKSFTKAKIGKILTALTKAVERYMVYQKAVENPFNFNLFLAEAYAERILDHRFELQIEPLQALSFQNTPKDLLNKYRVEELVYDYKVLRNSRRGDLNATNLIQALDLFYLTARFEYLLGVSAQNIVTRLDDFDTLIKTFDEVQDFALRLGLADKPAIRIYCLGLNVLLKEQQYETFCYELNQASDILSLVQLRMFHAIERNVMAKRFNKGNDSLCLSYFNMLKEHLHKGYMHYSVGLMMSSFLNIVTMGLHAGEYDWIAQFIETYAPQLVETEEKEELVQYHKANLAFHRGQIQEAYKLLPNYKFKDYAYELALRRLDIKISYELNMDSIDSKLNAFKNYLFEAHRRNLPTDKYEPNNNFVNMVKRMLELNLKMDKAIKLKEQLLASKHYTDRNWLLLKLDACIERHSKTYRRTM